MPDTERVVRVIGEGRETAVPDHCRVDLTLTASAETPALATEKTAALATSVTSRLREMGIEDRDIQTIVIHVHEWRDQKTQRVTKHFANYSLSVKVRGLDQVGPMLVTVGELSDEVGVQGIQLGISDIDQLREPARRKAVEDARTKATQLAEAAGVDLGPVLSIEETGWARPGMPVVGYASRRSSLGAGAPAPMPIEPGSMEVVVIVEMAFAIGG